MPVTAALRRRRTHPACPACCSPPGLVVFICYQSVSPDPRRAGSPWQAGRSAPAPAPNPSSHRRRRSSGAGSLATPHPTPTPTEPVRSRRRTASSLGPSSAGFDPGRGGLIMGRAASQARRHCLSGSVGRGGESARGTAHRDRIVSACVASRHIVSHRIAPHLARAGRRRAHVQLPCAMHPPVPRGSCSASRDASSHLALRRPSPPPRRPRKPRRNEGGSRSQRTASLRLHHAVRTATSVANFYFMPKRPLGVTAMH